MYLLVTLLYSGFVIYAPDYIVYLFPLISVLLILNYNNSRFFAFYIILVLTCNNVYASLGLVGINTFMIYTENLKYETTPKIFFALNVLVVLIGLLTAYNYNSVYDILMFATLISAYGLMTIEKRKADARIYEISIFNVLVILEITQILYRYIVKYERGSIFQLSENIGIIIFLLILINVLFSKSISILKKIIVILIYIWIVLLTESRMVPLLVIIVGIASIYSIFPKYKKLLLLGSALLATAVFFKYPTYLTEYSSRQAYIFDLTDNYVYNYSIIEFDPRVILFNDGIKKISQQPWLGNGVETPELMAIEGIKGSSFHSVTVDLLVTYGIIGSIVIILTLGYIGFVRYDFSNYYILLSVCSFLLLANIHPIFFNSKVAHIMIILLNTNTLAISEHRKK